MERLGAREESLLDTLMYLNAAEGVQPSKATLVAADDPRPIPNRTRADRYRIIDRLVGRGLVDSLPGSGGAYRLSISGLGVRTLAQHDANREVI